MIPSHMIWPTIILHSFKEKAEYCIRSIVIVRPSCRYIPAFTIEEQMGDKFPAYESWSESKSTVNENICKLLYRAGRRDAIES